MIEGIITQPDTTETSEQSADTNSTQTTNSQDVPQEYKNALAKAESYVSMMAMSKMGVYDQLTSEYGEGFPEDAAQYAIDNLDFDWNEVALEKAKSYYESMNMSKSGVYDQLVSEYGEQFTPQEAQYAIDNLD
ncbi:Ltp family lipoprotein [Aerococcaceae bacterium DSM 111022]|nr:Ltp family lipoprotein [Aerococcaceae bacterium DSM 111022]